MTRHGVWERLSNAGPFSRKASTSRANLALRACHTMKLILGSLTRNTAKDFMCFKNNDSRCQHIAWYCESLVSISWSNVPGSSMGRSRTVTKIWSQVIVMSSMPEVCPVESTSASTLSLTSQSCRASSASVPSPFGITSFSRVTMCFP